MIVPAVGVIVGDDDGGAGPEGRLLDCVDGVDDEGLLIERIGVRGVSVLVAGSLQEADCGQIACGQSIGEVMDIVLVFGGVRGSDRGDRGRPGVVGVDGAGIVLEWLMMSRVVGLGAGDGGDGGTSATGSAVRVGDGEVEATFKPAPGQIGGVEQVADVLAGQADR